jgi:hypothetical protein
MDDLLLDIGCIMKQQLLPQRCVNVLNMRVSSKSDIENRLGIHGEVCYIFV